ncbi:hypothetical protein [Phormidium sp. CCY1219]|uniref:hypothetical protein n=1 Tax=Phormidium sp. CCY1219 TaxID=2886104 RepID=UPI002D1F3F35|nr:hypothetical protein [Phormidium sp. CCY1219]MEB3826429.1 hypothetical protein [Phormidium sp. CCY1219]
MERTAQITQIIEKRRPLAEKIEAVEGNLRALSAALQSLEQQRDANVEYVSDPETGARLQDIDFSRMQVSLLAEREAIAKLKARFERPTLNIGVVGRARQGKSRLLQSLTGLTTAEIPDGDRQHCTGVRSTIYHNPNLETHGEVSFYTERSFLEEAIAPYYEQLGLGPKPLTLDDFAQQPLPPLPRNLSGAQSGAKYEHLRRYHTHLHQYRHLLQHPSPRRIAQSEIRQYVAQDTPDGDRIFYNYLAVREVKIVCSFPNANVGQIALVDMPGLGDTGIGDEERLLQTLGEDVDFVLFVRMPKSSGDYWADVDVKLYDTASAALADLPIALWSVMILNRTAPNSPNGDNHKNCQDLAATMAEKHIDVVQCLTVNCADAEAVNRQILDEVLDYLTAHIQRLDREYASTCQERIHQLRQRIQSELEKARGALGNAITSEREFPLFLQLFDTLWDDLTGALEGLLRELAQQRDTEDMDFKKQVNAAIASCRQNPGIPSIADIEIRRDRVGGYPNAYYQYLNEIRAALSKHFLSLDEGLKRAIERLKTQVAQVLREQGRLAPLTDANGSDFLSAMVETIPDSLEKLKLGFQILSEFNLSYRGLIQHRIRDQLDALTPDRSSLKLSQTDVSASEVLANLKTLHAETLYHCETALEELLIEPNQAAFAIVEEFVDRVLRAEGVKTEWQIFLEEVRGEIWENEFAQIGDRTRRKREWLDAVQRIEFANQTESLQFLSDKP